MLEYQHDNINDISTSKQIIPNNNLNSTTENRRYNSRNIDSGKKFFKQRFIQLLNQQRENNKIPSINIRPNQSKVSFSIDKTELKRKEEERKELKYSSLFTNKTDKAIFSFNIKKYDNAYQELLNIGIINNKEEFSEFLLVFPGFDKSIIGDFLAKDKSLNEGLNILKLYMKKINFKNEYFLDSLRFLVKRINLPKDANLINTIIDEFTQAYYKDNQDNKSFKNSDALYLLANVIMALNTMLTRKDIKNVNMIEKPKFITMNSDCDPEFLGELYDNLEKDPMVVEHDYIELIYKRETILKRLPDDQEKKNKNPDEILTEKQILDNIETTKKGSFFNKYGKDDQPHKRFFQLIIITFTKN